MGYNIMEDIEGFKFKEPNNDYYFINDPKLNILEGIHIPEERLEEINNKVSSEFSDCYLNEKTKNEIREYIKKILKETPRDD